MVLTHTQQEVLKLLADAREGSTVPILVRSGCTVEELHRLVRNGLASAERMQARGKPSSRPVLRIRISDAGRKALARNDAHPNHGILTKWVLLVLFALGVLAGVWVAVFMMPHA
jgi:hypothetical protein